MKVEVELYHGWIREYIQRRVGIEEQGNLQTGTDKEESRS